MTTTKQIGTALVKRQSGRWHTVQQKEKQYKPFQCGYNKVSDTGLKKRRQKRKNKQTKNATTTTKTT